MAKATKSPLNMWRGKAGSMVYRVRNGVQVVSALQSSVSNPRTEAQLAQRARFNLMTGMNRITPIEVLRGYAGTPAKKRAAFAKDLAKYITAQYVAPSGDDAGKYVGIIDPHDIHFDKLIESLFNSQISDVALVDDPDAAPGQAEAVQVQFSGKEVDAELENAILRVIDVFGPSSNPISVMYADKLFGYNSAVEFKFDGVGRHRIFAQLLVPTESFNSVAGTYPVNEPTNKVNIMSDLTAGESTNYTVGHCVYIGSHVIAEPQP